MYVILHGRDLWCFLFFFRYAVPDTPYSVPVSIATEELSSLINGAIKGMVTVII